MQRGVLPTKEKGQAMNNLAAVLYAPLDIRMEERPLPSVGPKDVLVAIRDVGVCGSDVHYYEHGRIGSFIVNQPLVLGHESAGVIVAAGSDIDQSRVGEAVAIEPGIPDGVCEQCRAGRYNLCPNMAYFGTPPINGAFSHYVSVPAHFAYTLPSNMTLEEGALVEPTSVALWACRKAQFHGGEHVLITGAGPIGILTMKVAFALGVAEVTITDIVPERLALARKYGATNTVNTSEQSLNDAGIKAQVFLECSGSQRALADGIRVLDPAGKVVVIGMNSGDELQVPISFIQQREISLTGIFRFAHTYEDAISMISSGRLEVKSLVTRRFSLNQVEKALQATKQDPNNLKSMVVLDTEKE
jgi:L-iditol 2-dehydrogenase